MVRTASAAAAAASAAAAAAASSSAGPAAAATSAAAAAEAAAAAAEAAAGAEAVHTSHPGLITRCSYQPEFIEAKSHNIIEVTERLFITRGRHSSLYYMSLVPLMKDSQHLATTDRGPLMGLYLIIREKGKRHWTPFQ